MPHLAAIKLPKAGSYFQHDASLYRQVAASLNSLDDTLSNEFVLTEFRAVHARGLLPRRDRDGLDLGLSHLKLVAKRFLACPFFNEFFHQEYKLMDCSEKHPISFLWRH